MRGTAPASLSVPTTKKTLQLASATLPNISPQRCLLDDYSGVNPIARVLLAGALLPSNKESPFSELSICLHLVEEIYRVVRDAWKEDIIIGAPKTHPAFSNTSWVPRYRLTTLSDMDKLSKTWSIAQIDSVSFPPPRGININMMPIVLNSRGNSGIPNEFEHYADIINKCCRFQNSWFPHIGYLTIRELRVETEQSQRCPGIHTEGVF